MIIPRGSIRCRLNSIGSCTVLSSPSYNTSVTHIKNYINITTTQVYNAPYYRTFATMQATVPRSDKYSKLTDEHIAALCQIAGDNGYITANTPDASELQPYNVDWMKKFSGQTRLVLRPSTTELLSKLLQYCNQHKLAVVPQSGNTGLVGGSIPMYDEIIISVNRLNKIINIDEMSGICTFESGVILEAAQNKLDEHGLLFPLDLGAKGSCMIGGVVSTNAGGLRFLRYGSLHGSVLGMKVVLPTGEIMNLSNELRKDNTGYDLKQLFIGGEGTLGIISELNVLCARKPLSVQTCFLGVNSFDNVLQVMQRARTEMSDIVSAIEFQDKAALEIVIKTDSSHTNPFDSNYNYYVLIETHGSNTQHDNEKLQTFLSNCFESQLIVDGTIAESVDQTSNLWKFRENITESLSKHGFVYKYDISLPVKIMYSAVDLMKERLNKYDVQVYGYGHLGDGNLHLNIVSKKFDQNILDDIEPYLFEWVHSKRGSISAEHGLGQTKNKYLHLAKSDSVIQWMKQLKSLFDPNHILNPYKYLPNQIHNKQ